MTMVRASGVCVSFLIATSFACAKPPAGSSVADAHQVAFELSGDAPDASAVATSSVFSQDAGALLFGNGHRVILNDVSDEGSWPVTLLEAQQADGPLSWYLQRERPDIAAKLDDYDGQFWGESTSDGHRVVVLNFFCRSGQQVAADGSHRPDWTVNRIHVKDGGSCYFQAYFNVSFNRFFRLDVNGDA